jgi:glycosyltransferase involved in cell wall biosynthesis
MKSSFIYFVEDTETSFVLNDLRQIAKKYDRVILLSAESIDNKNELPENTEVFENFINWKQLNIKQVFLSNFFSILLIYFKECLASRKLLSFKESIALLCSNFYKAAECQKVLSELKDLDIKTTPFYAFWFYDCIYLARLKQLGIASKTYARAHGGDLFEERSSLYGKVLFRHYQLGLIDNVFSVSETGTNYLKNKYPAYSGKILTLYLGSFHHDFSNTILDDNFTLVSCAKIRDIKRIHLIAEALKYINFNCTWYHIGDENLTAKNDEGIPLYLSAKESLKSKSNITFKPIGSLSNTEVFDFYRSTPINVFISTSASEGIPVSMMEAISFGIPVISTDVGGCHEIVNESSGMLIPSESKPEEIALAINEFRNSDKNGVIFREKTKLFWLNKFDAAINYNHFFNLLRN